MVRTCRVTGCRANTLVFLGNHGFCVQCLSGYIAPQVLANALVQGLGKGFGQPVGQGLEHDGRVIVMVIVKVLLFLLGTQSSGYSKNTDVIGFFRVI